MPLAVEQDWKSELNDAQRQAVKHNTGPLIVLAGPGTGKTRVIISRLRRLIEEGAEPESLLALTFSVKAAEEMRERLASAVGSRVAERVRASTFHSFGNSILLRFGDMLGLPQARTFMDSAQFKRLLRELIRANGLFADLAALGPDAGIERATAFIEECRHSAKTDGDAAAYLKAWEKEHSGRIAGMSDADREAEEFRLRLFRDCARVFALFERACMERGLLTFDHCLALPLRLMRERPVVATILRQEIRHVVIDEFQDDDQAQISMLEMIAPPRDDAGRSADICVVGDDDQAIYAFRGADDHSFRRFAEIWSDATTIPLTVNYRSGPAVIAAANAHIARCDERFAPDKRIEASGADRPSSVEGVIVDANGIEGSVVGAMIKLDRAENPERRYSDYAVLGRSHVIIQAAAASLEALDIPVVFRQKVTPLDDPGVQDLMAWLSLIVEPRGPGEPAAAQRLLARPPFFVPVETIARWNDQRRAGMWESRGGDGMDATFVGWLRANQGGDASVAGFLGTLADLRETAATAAADLVIERIIRRAELAHAEDLTPRQRASRVRSLVQVLQFARSRQPYLEQPGDIHAFWRYYQDLDKDEKQFVASGAERLDHAADAASTLEESGRDAVMLMTAHASKGLEFDTVFLLRCRPGGFPWANRADDSSDDLPAEFFGRSEVNRSDEERRLFYVAATRAERRLVMLAKRKKSRTGPPDYYNELTLDSSGISIDQHEGAHILEQAGLEPPGELDAPLETTDEERRREALVFRAGMEARRRAYSALREAGDARHSGEEMAAIEARLVESARELRAIDQLRAAGALPPECAPEVRERLAGLVARYERALGPAPLTTPLKAPLSLSYSSISDYQRCPRCFYVKYIMNLDERKTAELSMGSVIHGALEQFYKEWRECDSEGRPTPGLARLHACAEAALRTQVSGGVAEPEALLATVKAQLTLCFERLHEPDAHIMEVERKVKFDYPDPAGGVQAHRIAAKIDRVDQLPSGGFRVIDYKSGKASKKLLTPAADDLQMCIYRLALPAMLGDDPGASNDAIEGVAEYWILSEGVKGAIDFGAMNLDKARKAIDKAVTGMLEGQFGRGRECKGLCDILPDEGAGPVQDE